VTLGATVTDVGPVVVTASFPGRGGCRCVVSESQAGAHGKEAESFACRELLRDLCRGFVPLCGAGAPFQSPATLRPMIKAMRHLARVVDEREGADASSMRLRDLTTDDLEALEARLLRDNPQGNHAWVMSRSLARLLVAIDEEWPGRVPAAVRQRTRFQTLPHPGNAPRESFSAFVTVQLRRACLSDMKEVTARILEGAVLVHGGVDPESGGWDNVSNVMWAIDSSRGEYIYGPLARKVRQVIPEPFDEIVGRLYPSVHDLMPFLVMLGLQSGLPIECVTSLRRDCLRNPAGGTVQIDHEKWRAGPSPFRSKRYPDGGLRTPGGIVRAVLEVTERAALHSASPWLFVGYGKRHLGRPAFHHESKVVFADRHNLVDDSGEPLVLRLSRLRKTRMVEWAHEVKGDPEALSRLGDHTLQVNWESYADVDAMRPIYEETIAAALAQAVRTAELAVKARVVTAEEEVSLRADASVAAVELGVAEDEVAGVLDGDSDTWMAACTGFERSPFARPGSPCPEPFWGCLECPNAVIQERKLPAILAALDAMVGERARMSPEAWRARFGRPFLRIVNDIIPAFGAGAWERARQAAGVLVAVPAGVFDG
jgi:hypothetical protein